MDGMGSNGEVSSEESGSIELKKSVELVQESIPNKATNRKSVLSLTKVSSRVAKHGLAPAGMAIPLRKKAFRVGGSDLSKCPLKESSQEKYHRIKAEQEERKKKQHHRAVNKLKKGGKVVSKKGSGLMKNMEVRATTQFVAVYKNFGPKPVPQGRRSLLKWLSMVTARVKMGCSSDGAGATGPNTML
jgi:hypothetical protein